MWKTLKNIAERLIKGGTEMANCQFYRGNQLNNKSDDLKKIIKDYLCLDNVSLLFGAGSSYHLNVKTIRDFPNQIESDLSSEDKITFFDILKKMKNIVDIDSIRSNTTNNIEIPFEDVINYLQALLYVKEKSPNEIPYKNIENIIKSIKKSLLKLCDINELGINSDYTQDVKLKENNLYYHERLIKKLCQRPLNLKRANIFTTNYDLAFDYAFDNLGIHSINGFSGFHNRFFRPEVYDYDVYFPGATTSGKVHRLEKVIRYYKLHGSLSWIETKRSLENVYGIQELPLEFIKNNKEISENIIVYPSSTKKQMTLDLPYSELFRNFANIIRQPQSVLITVGYSFNDEHINDIIYQALAVPSFTLIVVDFIGTENETITKLRALDDNRIIIIEKDSGKFTEFVENIMPDLYSDSVEDKVVGTLKTLIDKK